MKKLLSLIGVAALAVALFFIFKNISLAPAPQPANEKTEIEKIKIDPSVPGITLPLSTDPKDVAWALFEKYLGYNKAKNIEGVKSTVYKLAPVCEDPKTRIDCEGRMGAAYAYGSQLKKEDFNNVWADDRQIILASDFKTQEDDSAIGRNRSLIFFVKDEAGGLKMLSFSPSKGVVASKGLASPEELEDRMITYTEDQDQDGIADYEEQCLAVKEGQTCVKTNPKLRDTNGNGLWDGIDALMNGTR